MNKKHKIRKVLLKRLKITGTGKIMRGRQNARHLRSSKTKRQTRRFSEPQALSLRQQNLLIKFIK